jgi:hypothetical protein
VLEDAVIGPSEGSLEVGFEVDEGGAVQGEAGAPYEVRVMSRHEFSRVGYSLADMDNLVVYDHPKTDFSDRFVETPN